MVRNWMYTFESRQLCIFNWVLWAHLMERRAMFDEKFGSSGDNELNEGVVVGGAPITGSSFLQCAPGLFNLGSETKS